MALRAVPDHPKFMAFKSMLRLPKGAALGWIESIWHFAGRFTPHGNIGKYSDLQIEAWVEWDGAPGALIVALMECGWIDESVDHRLLIHDWAQHSDKATKEAVKRSKKPFIEHGMSTACEQRGHETPELSVPYPLPVPVPVPESLPDPVPVPVPFAPAPEEPIAGTPFLDMPTNRAGESFTVTEEALDEWNPLYPAVDVRQQVRNMRGWLDGNPDRRKTRKGMTRFIHNWLGDKQNKAGSNGASTGSTGGGSHGSGAAGRVGRTLAASREAAARRRGTGSLSDSDGADVGLLPAPGILPGDGGRIPVRHGATSGEIWPDLGQGGAARPPATRGPEILPPPRTGS